MVRKTLLPFIGHLLCVVTYTVLWKPAAGVESGDRTCLLGGSSGLQESTTHQIFATALHVLEAVRFYEYQCLEAIIICVSEVLLLFPLVL